MALLAELPKMQKWNFTLSLTPRFSKVQPSQRMTMISTVSPGPVLLNQESKWQGEIGLEIQ